MSCGHLKHNVKIIHPLSYIQTKKGDYPAKSNRGTWKQEETKIFTRTKLMTDDEILSMRKWGTWWQRCIDSIQAYTGNVEFGSFPTGSPGAQLITALSGWLLLWSNSLFLHVFLGVFLETRWERHPWSPYLCLSGAVCAYACSSLQIAHFCSSTAVCHDKDHLLCDTHGGPC